MLLENRQGSSGHSANRQQKRSWEPGPGHVVGGYRRTQSFLEISAEQGRRWRTPETRHSGDTEICISGNTGGTQFEEDSNNKKSTKKGETQLKKQIKETKQHEIVFYSLSEMPQFALK